MILFGDYHTHTIYSRKRHASGTVLENALVAQQKGLKEIAITDHGFNHRFFSVKRKKWDNLFEDVENAKKETNVNILLGIESNLISMDGDIDLTEEEKLSMDIILMGYHNCTKAKTCRDAGSLFVKNHFSQACGYCKRQIEKNTTAYLKAMEKNRIDVITHLNYGMKVNTLEVAKMARDTETYIELNGKRILFSDDEMVRMAEIGVKFIVDSDAHCSTNVGECNNAL
ncbi:MAG: PHP domain-containing protein, partial [Clostridia bacterium]